MNNFFDDNFWCQCPIRCHLPSERVASNRWYSCLLLSLEGKAKAFAFEEEGSSPDGSAGFLGALSLTETVEKID